ncbi:hypothetical protein BCR33DRAFT_740412 [Rhizoclosmatium globosum]|uniref:Uncharacterized protein n=1 Tax=Rhizoclosmatium globosum TaxID=329046 RepID=A0A1Y2BZD2_9FUNG|nr:hypothetical protein BCR33DRAFT_740412 [Rhizoclosmatium globosum]|eukprot:ORY40121.1 hypothetical protein BCR33DRAFT_740412 [Rhizoclosmatium globosum]
MNFAPPIPGASEIEAPDPFGRPPVNYGSRRNPDPDYFLPIKYKVPKGTRALCCVRMHLENAPDYYSLERPEFLGDKIPEDVYRNRMIALNEDLATNGVASMKKLKNFGRWSNWIGWTIFLGGLVAGFKTGEPIILVACVFAKIVLMWMPMTADYVEMVKEHTERWNEEDAALVVDVPLEGVQVVGEALPVYEKNTDGTKIELVVVDKAGGNHTQAVTQKQERLFWSNPERYCCHCLDRQSFLEFPI